MACLKAAVSKGADAVYLGMQKFNAREFATNFNESFLREAIDICHSNNVKVYLTMNTLVKNHEIFQFFQQLSIGYSSGVDAVIFQDPSFIEIIKRHYPKLEVHVSTQAGVMNSMHAQVFSSADSVTLARELTYSEISEIRKRFSKKIEVFCHGALCVCLSGSCLFSSLLGGRSGNRGKCAQPCRKLYDGCYYLSTKDLCLIKEIPLLIKAGIDIIKIEGRMRTPYYVATASKAYRDAIDSYYDGKFQVDPKMIVKLKDAFNRGFSEGWFSSCKDIFNRKNATGFVGKNIVKEQYYADYKKQNVNRKNIDFILNPVKPKQFSDAKIIARAYNKEDAISAANAGADTIYFDIFDSDFDFIRRNVSCKVFAVTPRIMLDKDISAILSLIQEKKPDGLFIGNIGLLKERFDIPVHIDYNCNCFNDLDVEYFNNLGGIPIISPELSFREIKQFKDKRFISFVHGKIRLMTLRHEFDKKVVKDEIGAGFFISHIKNGSEILNEKELGLLSKSKQLVDSGINNLFIDTDKNVSEIVNFYRKILDNQKADDSKLKKNYVLGWAYRGVY
jgi:collagenase-like PrtC family protease